MNRFEFNRTQPLDELSDDMVQNIFDASATVVDIPDSLLFSVAVVTNEDIAPLNKQYRGKEGPTDVLSFRYDEENGEILLSVDKIRAQAAEYGHDVRTEAAFLLVHGILHILGWDHERSEKEAKEMRNLEITILQQCGLNCAR